MAERFHIAVERRVRQRIDLVVEAPDARLAAAMAKGAAIEAKGSDAWHDISDEIETTGAVATDLPVGPVEGMGGTDRLRAFYDDDPEFLAFHEAQMEGESPIGIVMDERGVLHFSNGGRDEFASVTWSVDGYVVTQTTDPLKLLDPEADVYHRGTFSEPREAVAKACDLVGYEYAPADTPAP